MESQSAVRGDRVVLAVTSPRFPQVREGAEISLAKECKGYPGGVLQSPVIIDFWNIFGYFWRIQEKPAV